MQESCSHGYNCKPYVLSFIKLLVFHLSYHDLIFMNLCIISCQIIVAICCDANYIYFNFFRKVRRQITVTELRRAARKPCRKLMNLKIPFYYDNPIVPATVTTPLPGIAATAPPETLAVNE